MLIAAKRKNQILNVGNSIFVFVNNENRIIGTLASGRNMVLDEYDSQESAKKAMEILIDRLSAANEHTTICLMPTDAEVKAAMIKDIDKTRVHHYEGGQKIRRRGGS